MKTINAQTLGSLERDFHNEKGVNAYADYLAWKKGKSNNEKRDYLLSKIEAPKGININV